MRWARIIDLLTGLPATEIYARELAPAQRHSVTSIESAKQIEPHLGPLQTKVLECLKRWPEGLTDLEIQDALGMDPSTERPRRGELERKKLIKNSGRTRATRSGRQAVVWEVA